MDIRKELNKLSVPQLKAIARKHNAHYIVRLGVRKVELVEKLASLYESMRDEYMSSRPYEINVKNPKMNVIRKRAEPVPVRAVEAPKQRPKPAVDLIAKLEMGLDEREKEIEKIKTGMQEILKKKELTGIKEKARGALSALVAKQKEPETEILVELDKLKKQNADKYKIAQKLQEIKAIYKSRDIFDLIKNNYDSFYELYKSNPAEIYKQLDILKRSNAENFKKLDTYYRKYYPDYNYKDRNILERLYDRDLNSQLVDVINNYELRKKYNAPEEVKKRREQRDRNIKTYMTREINKFRKQAGNPTKDYIDALRAIAEQRY